MNAKLSRHIAERRAFSEANKYLYKKTDQLLSFICALVLLVCTYLKKFHRIAIRISIYFLYYYSNIILKAA